MDEITYYKCKACQYEFLGRAKSTLCPRCKSGDLEPRKLADIKPLDD